MQHPAWSKDGSGVYFQYDGPRDDRDRFHRVGRCDWSRSVAETSAARTLGRPYASGSFSVADDGTRCLHADAARPPGRRRRRHTFVRTTTRRLHVASTRTCSATRRLARWRRSAYKSSHDGRKIQGWIVKPPHFDAKKKYPLILEIHGGPYANYGARFCGRDAALRRGRLCRALHQPARQHRLWRGVRQADPPQLSGPRLRRPDVRRRCCPEARLRRCGQPVRDRRQRRRRADGVDRRQDEPFPRRRRRPSRSSTGTASR